MRAQIVVAGLTPQPGVTFSSGHAVQVCQGSCVGLSGTLLAVPVAERAIVELERGILLEIDLSCLQPKDRSTLPTAHGDGDLEDC